MTNFLLQHNIYKITEQQNYQLPLTTYTMSTGPIQFIGPTSNIQTQTLALELGAQA